MNARVGRARHCARSTVIGAFVLIAACSPLSAFARGQPREAVPLGRLSSLDETLERSSSHRYRVELLGEESLELTVTQRGVDVVLELFDPGGTRIGSTDAPNGREGDERLQIVAGRPGVYEILVRPFDQNEPTGDYRIAVTAWRDPASTRAWLAERSAERQGAADWLKVRAGNVCIGAESMTGAGLDRFDALAAQSRVVGLGEATHGSRELGDARLALTRRLVEHHGFRVIALEASSSRLRAVDAWTRRPNDSEGRLREILGPGWIGRRPLIALAEFARQWNLAHTSDPVSLVGLDAQDNAPARDAVAALALRAYPGPYGDRLAGILDRLAAADAQAAVFGPSGVDQEDWRALQALLGRLCVERAILAERIGEQSLQDAIEGVRDLVQFAEFNTTGFEEPRRSRDWMLAANLLRVLSPGTRAAYWGHNAHVAHTRAPSPDAGTAGAILREILQSQYGAIGTCFHKGGFLAQLPNDPGDRLQTFTLPPASIESIDGIIHGLGLGDAIITWPPPNVEVASDWLTRPQPMYWIGALFSPESLPHEWVRNYRLTHDFDGVVFISSVQPEIVPEIGVHRAP